MGNVLICQSPRNPKNDKLVNPPNESEQKTYSLSKLGENVNDTNNLEEPEMPNFTQDFRNDEIGGGVIRQVGGNINILWTVWSNNGGHDLPTFEEALKKKINCTYSHQKLDENSDGCLTDQIYEEVPNCTQDFSSDGFGGGAIRQVGGNVNLIGSNNGGDDLPASEGDFSPISSPIESDYSESSEFKIYLSSCSHKETRDDSCLSRESDLWWNLRNGCDPSNTADSHEPLFKRSMTAPIGRLKEKPLIHGFRIGQTVLVKHKKLKHDGKLGIIDKWCPVRNRFRINIYNDQAYMKPEDLEHTSLKPIDRKAMQPR